MSDKMKKILTFLKNPPTYVKILTFLVTILSSIGSIVIAIAGLEEGSFLAVLSYIIFAVAGVSLGYSVYLLIPIIPNIKRSTISFLEKREFTRRVLKSYGFRTLVFAFGTFVLSIFFGAVNAYMGIINDSIWYGALATYYILLAIMRGGILLVHQKGIDEQRSGEIALYRRCGIILLVLNVALSSAIAQMIFEDAHFSFVGWTIFAYAAYAFFKIGMSIYNLIKAHKQESLTIRAIRNINLADATVSILALQTALLTAFSEGDIDISLMNTMTGIVVSAFAVGLGVYMIVYANKINKKEDKANE